MAGLYVYIEKTGNFRTLWMLLFGLLLLAADCALMLRGVRRRSRRTRAAAYGTTALSALCAAAACWYFTAGPGRYAPTGRLEPELEQLLSFAGTLLFPALLLAFFCWGYHRRVLDLTEGTES